jgi:dTDP-D-glucose 4,6-dehydratase
MIPVRKINSNKFMSKFNWTPKTSLDNGLKLTYDWYIENKKEFE